MATIDYGREVKQEALDFLSEQEEMVIEALAQDLDWDRNSIDGLDDNFRWSFTDRDYLLQDAAWVLANCTREEEESALWQRSDPEEALKSKAAYSFGNDVWARLEGLYEDLQNRVSDFMSEIDYDDRGLEDENAARLIEQDGKKFTLRLVVADPAAGEKVYVALEGEDTFAGVVIENSSLDTAWYPANTPKISFKRQNPAFTTASQCVAGSLIKADGDVSSRDIELALRRGAAKDAFQEVLNKSRPATVAPGTDDERTLLSEWVRMSSAAGMIGNYPLGRSYLDPRCGKGYAIPDQLAYVRFDHEAGQRLPHLAGRDRADIKEYIRKTFGPDSPETAEEALGQIRALIRARAEWADFYDLADDIDRILGDAPRP